MQISCGIQGNTRWKQRRYKNMTSSPLCVSVVFSILCSSLPLLCHSFCPSNHIYFHFRPHHLIIKHPRFHFLKWSQCRSASCVGLSLFIPPDELGGLYTVKKESHRVNAQILMSATKGGDVGSIATVINTLLLNTFDLVLIRLCFLHSLWNKSLLNLKEVMFPFQ